MAVWLAVVGAVAVVELAALIVLLRRHRALQQSYDDLAESVRPREPESVVLAGAAKAVELAARTASRLRSGGIGGVLTGSLDDVVRWAREDRTAIVRVATPEGLVTFAFTDIEDSTAANVRLGDRAWLKVLQAHDALVREQVTRHGGHVVKSQGDGFMLVFGAADTAVHAAVAIQRAVTHRPPRPLRNTPIRLRIGLHVGTAVSRDGDYFGRNVALAARVAAEARGGEILLSDDTWAALDAAATDGDDARQAEARHVRLKGFDEVQTVHALHWN